MNNQVEGLQESIAKLRTDIKEAKGRGDERERQQRDQLQNMERNISLKSLAIKILLSHIYNHNYKFPIRHLFYTMIKKWTLPKNNNFGLFITFFRYTMYYCKLIS